MPGPELPYVVAIVELIEDPSIRVTTNLINCPHDSITSGMPVHVTFEHHEDPDGDVWLPLFEPAVSDAVAIGAAAIGAAAAPAQGISTEGTR